MGESDMAEGRVSLVVADDHPLYREGVVRHQRDSLVGARADPGHLETGLTGQGESGAESKNRGNGSRPPDPDTARQSTGRLVPGSRRRTACNARVLPIRTSHR